MILHLEVVVAYSASQNQICHQNISKSIKHGQTIQTTLARSIKEFFRRLATASSFRYIGKSTRVNICFRPWSVQKFDVLNPCSVCVNVLERICNAKAPAYKFKGPLKDTVVAKVPARNLLPTGFRICESILDARKICKDFHIESLDTSVGCDMI